VRVCDKGLELDLELRDPQAKSYTRQYPLSVADTEEIEKQVKQLYDAGVLRENDDCSQNSPVLCVGEKGRLVAYGCGFA